MEFKTLNVALEGQVAHIELNRPERANALELTMWTELRDAMRWLDETAAARVGGGIDLICACDLRYCSADAFFSVKEIDVGLTADVGTLQRLPHIVGEGAARELAYTGRKVGGAEAKELRLVNQCYPDRDALMTAMRELAATLAAKPPLALRGCKEMITYARDHTVADGLNYVATWNAAMLLSTDLDEALAAGREQRAAKFRD